MLLSLVLTIGIALGGREQNNGVQHSEIPYRLLWSDKLGEGDRSQIGYVVSVDRLLDRADIEKLICQVVLKENPLRFSWLAISIYHQLNDYMPPNGAPTLEAILRDHAVAYYRWNVSLPDSRNRLLLVRNRQG